MRIQLSEHFTYGKLLRFTLPSIVMMIFTSIYGVVDGLFVSNYVGKTPFAAVNLIFPLLIILGALGFMVGTGGTAIVAKTLGEGDHERANRYFSMMVYVTILGGTVLGALGILLTPQASRLLGAEGEMLESCVIYGRVVLIGLPFFMLQNVFQSFFVAAEKPKLGLGVTVAAGVTNMVLDALFVGILGWGIVGAAAATATSQFMGGMLPVVYFARKNDSLLRLGRTRFYGRVLLRTCTNGSSELMSNISASVVTMLYNFQLMRFAGEDGVAAYGAIMYVGFIFVSIFIGYAVGSAPVVSFHYGAGHTDELHSLLWKSVRMLAACGIAMAATAFALSAPLSKLFVGYDATLYAMTVRGFRVHALHYVFAGFNIYGSSFFTALNNGGVSAAISFLRTLVFQCLSVLILPVFFELDGVWFSVLTTELCALCVTVLFLKLRQKRYHY